MAQCKECNQEFKPNRKTQIFCSRKCSKKNWRNIPKNKEKENQQRRNYYNNHQKDEKRKAKERRKLHPEKQKDYDKNRYWNNREEELERNKHWKDLNPAEQRAYHKKHRDKLKIDVITHYSNGIMACANPYNQHREPYTDIRALSIDHIEGGGCKHRLSLKSGSFYRWLRKNDYPFGYQVLCMNCQFIKRDIEKECKKPIERV